MSVDKTQSALSLNLQGAFTIIELVLVIAIGVVLLALTTPVGVSFYQRVLAGDATEEVVGILREASNDARLGKNDLAHGVFFGSGSVTHFQGESYATRVLEADYVVPLHSRVNISGIPSEVVFLPHTGEPSATGTLTLALNGNVHTVLIHPLGHIWDTTVNSFSP